MGLSTNVYWAIVSLPFKNRYVKVVGVEVIVVGVSRAFNLKKSATLSSTFKVNCFHVLFISTFILKKNFIISFGMLHQKSFGIWG